MTIDEFVSRLERAKRAGKGWQARCPAHEDRTPSLSVHEGDEGRILVRCHAGCTTDKICAALGLRLFDLFPGPPIDWSRFTPKTPEERQAADLRRLRRHVHLLQLEQRRAMLALNRACLLAAIAYSEDPDVVLDRLWSGAVADLERQAAADADAYCRSEEAA
jgi:hypothetical protein